MMLGYEDISNRDLRKASESADSILAAGWVRRNYPTIDLGAPIPWGLVDHGSRSWNFYVHCWDMLDVILAANSSTGESRYLVPAVNIALDWVQQHVGAVNDDVSPFAWYDMAVGLRAYRLAYVIDAGDAAGLLNEEQRTALWSALEAHRRYLEDDANIAFHNNHGFYQVAGQLAMSRRFAATSEEMARCGEQGRERLRRMIWAQFSEEGVHREHSPDYHRMVCDTLRAIIDSGLVVDPDVLEFADRIEESLSWFVLPDRHIANFGDSDFRLLARKPAEAERKWRSGAMRYMVSGGQTGTLPDSDVAAFERGGYFVVRQVAPDAPEDMGRMSYLAQQAGFHSRTHKHADDLSFIWSDRGSNLLVDAGRYGYVGKVRQGSELWRDGHWYEDPNRVFCESTRAHNTVEFDGRNNLRRGVTPYGSAIRRWLKTSDGIFVVETEIKQHRSIRHVRVLFFSPGRWLIVHDWYHDNLDRKHSARQWFHLAPSLQALSENGGYLVPVPTSDQPLRVLSLLEDPQASRLYLGEEGSEMQGWWSAKEKDIVPAYAFCFELQDTRSGCFATILCFSSSLSRGKPGTSRINVSGRKGQMRWSDDEGDHRLSFERPATGALSVEYDVQKRNG